MPKPGRGGKACRFEDRGGMAAWRPDAEAGCDT
jgi:hypothetical protein